MNLVNLFSYNLACVLETWSQQDPSTVDEAPPEIKLKTKTKVLARGTRT